MKLIKMSLVAALLVGSSAFAIENVKVSGDANLFYSTSEAHDHDLFDQTSAMGETSLNLGLTADLTKSVSAGATLNAISTLGLYNNLVDATWTGGIQDNFWFGEAWLAATHGKTTAKAGRMQLDTPVVFSETWSVVPNTFEAAVLINQDLPDTTLVGAFVGQHNSAAALGGGFDDFTTSPFKSFYNGAYAVGAINNSIESLTAQAWYYDATHAAKALWLQGDVNVKGFKVGAQYTNTEYAALDENNYAVAAMIGYEVEHTFKAKLAYSQTGKKAAFAKAGVLTGANLAGSQSKLYTEAWWAYGYVSQADATAITAEAEYEMHDVAEFGVFYTLVDNAAEHDHGDMQEVTLTASRSYGAMDATLALINSEEDGHDAFNMVQVYLTLNF